MSKKDIMLGNFLGGLSWGFGTVIGATVVVAILIYGLKGLGIFEPIKSIFEVSPVIQRTLPKSNE